MKKVKSIFFILAMLIGIGGFCTSSSCSKASKYSDDVLKSVKKPKKRAPRERQCQYCGGLGRVYDPYYNSYLNCNGCGGDGRVWVYEEAF